MSAEQKLELLKSALSLGVSLATVSLSWLVGLKLTTRWNLRQKQRELDLISAQEFHRLYGEFFVCWKLWNHAFDGGGPEKEKIKCDLLLRACSAEGAVEALLVRLASTRDLGTNDVELLGRFRQAYQTLRESVIHNHRIDWNSDSHPDYLDLKHGATTISLLIISDSLDAPLNQDLVYGRGEALKEITSNKWEAANSDREGGNEIEASPKFYPRANPTRTSRPTKS